MKVLELKCPYCGANLHIEKDRKTCTCEYCDQTIFIDDEVKRQSFTYKKVDEARIKEAEIKAKQEEYRILKEKNTQAQWKLQTRIKIIAIVLALLVVSIFIIKSRIQTSSLKKVILKKLAEYAKIIMLKSKTLTLETKE